MQKPYYHLLTSTLYITGIIALTSYALKQDILLDWMRLPFFSLMALALLMQLTVFILAVITIVLGD